MFVYNADWCGDYIPDTTTRPRNAPVNEEGHMPEPNDVPTHATRMEHASGTVTFTWAEEPPHTPSGLSSRRPQPRTTVPMGRYWKPRNASGMTHRLLCQPRPR